MNDIDFKMQTVAKLASIDTNIEHILAFQKDCPVKEIKTDVDKMKPKVKTNRALTLISFTVFLVLIVSMIIKGV